MRSLRVMPERTAFQCVDRVSTGYENEACLVCLSLLSIGFAEYDSLIRVDLARLETVSITSVQNLTGTSVFKIGFQLSDLELVGTRNCICSSGGFMKVAQIPTIGEVFAKVTVTSLSFSLLFMTSFAPSQAQLQGTIAKTKVKTRTCVKSGTYMSRHPKVKSATVGAGVGAGVGAVTGL